MNKGQIKISKRIYFISADIVACVEGVMEKSKQIKELKIGFGALNDKNVNLIQEINLAVLPVIYSQAFYAGLPDHDKFTKLGTAARTNFV